MVFQMLCLVFEALTIFMCVFLHSFFVFCLLLTLTHFDIDTHAKRGQHDKKLLTVSSLSDLSLKLRAFLRVLLLCRYLHLYNK